MHAHLAHAEGKAVANILVVYGVPGKEKVNKALWNAVIQYTARLGNVAWMICADCNFPLHDENALPDKFFTPVRLGRLVDVMKCRAESRGQAPLPTYDGGANGHTRIDGILMDPKLASVVTHDEVWRDPGLLGHAWLAVELDLNAAAQKVMKLRKLPDPQESSMNPEEQNKLAAAM